MEFQIILSKKQPWHITADKKSTFFQLFTPLPHLDYWQKSCKEFQCKFVHETIKFKW